MSDKERKPGILDAFLRPYADQGMQVSEIDKLRTDPFAAAAAEEEKRRKLEAMKADPMQYAAQQEAAPMPDVDPVSKWNLFSILFGDPQTGKGGLLK
jgi:hypothetical protein